MSVEEPLSVLLVDDRPEQLLALEATLLTLGHNLIRARSGKEALRHLLGQDFAVILLDVQMPIVDGFETAALIRQRDRSRDTPIIFLTGVERAEAQMFRGYSLGAVDYVLKPVVPEVIRAKVAVFIELARKTRMLERQADLLQKNHRTLVELTTARAHLLADLEMSTTLSASLDLQETLRRVAELAAGRLSEWCMIDVVDEDGAVCGSASSHSDSSLRAALEASHADRDAAWGVLARRVRDSGLAVVENPFDGRGPAPGSDASDRPSDGGARALRPALAVPLVARGRTIGVMTLGARMGFPDGGQVALELAEEFADRASLAIDNACLYRAAEEAIRARDDFLCVASHELRTPLTPLRLHSDSLCRAVQGPEDLTKKELLERAGKIQRQCSRLERLVDHLLDVSRIGARRLDITRERMDLVPTVTEAVERAREEVGAAGPQISLQTPSSVVGSWDRLRLEQVVSNLLSNALKYGEGRAVDVSVESARGSVCVRVRDRGGGIPPEEQRRIFGRFERAAHSRHVGGLGLGLWIVNRIITAHGGIVRVELADGGGTVFSFELPTLGEG